MSKILGWGDSHWTISFLSCYAWVSRSHRRKVCAWVKGGAKNWKLDQLLVAYVPLFTVCCLSWVRPVPWNSTHSTSWHFAHGLVTRLLIQWQFVLHACLNTDCFRETTTAVFLWTLLRPSQRSGSHAERVSFSGHFLPWSLNEMLFNTMSKIRAGHQTPFHKNRDT